MLFIADSSLGDSFTIRALVTVIATLIGPMLALIRWIQERTTKHRYREEITRSRELLDFIQRCPDMLSAVSSPPSEVLERARNELAQLLGSINKLLEKQSTTAARPKEMAWPRRLLLLYAPRTWTATFLHALFHLLTVFGLATLWFAGIDDQTGAFQWNSYSPYLHLPFLLSGVVFFGMQVFLLWYLINTKDRWDKTLPLSIRNGEGFFLRQIPVGVRDTFARGLLAWSIFDIASSLALRGQVCRALQSPMIAPFVGELPPPSMWRYIYGWIASIMCIVVAYLWARAEFNAQGKTPRLRFPHNFRFLYPASRWYEAFAQVLVVVFAIYTGLQIYVLYESLPLFKSLAQLAPYDARSGFLTGVFVGPTLIIFWAGLLPLYASHRLGLLTYFSRTESAGKRDELKASTRSSAHSVPSQQEV